MLNQSSRVEEPAYTKRPLMQNESITIYARAAQAAVLDDGTLLCSNPDDRRINNIRQRLRSMGYLQMTVTVTAEEIESLYNEQDIENGLAADHQDLIQVEDSSALKKLDSIIHQAFINQASDIHIEVRQSGTVVRNRINSYLETVEELSYLVGVSTASVCFSVLARKDFSIEKMQQGTFTHDFKGVKHRIRINAQPVQGGCDVCLRFLSSIDQESERRVNKAVPSLEDLGYEQLHRFIINEGIQRGRGVIIIAGPTGSGKTTSFASIISLIPKYLKIYTIEDPVEKIIPNASQINLRADAEDTIELSERAKLVQKNLLRQDPDAALLGEVRDLSYAETLIEMASTGHLAMATLHTEGVIAILQRLNDLGIPWARLADPGLLNVLVYQRLVRVLCNECKLAYPHLHPKHPFFETTETTKYIKWRINHALTECENDPSQVFTRNPEGCSKCRAGITDRRAVVEVIRSDHTLCRYISSGDILGLKEHLEKVGWESVTDHAMKLVREGVIDPYEADMVAGPIGSEAEKNCFNYQQFKTQLSEEISHEN